MAKQASKTVIGVFVVSSIAMLIAGVIIFGSGEMFKKKLNYVMFFEDSIKGLSVGAPVVFHGVAVGSVSSIILKVDTEKLAVDIPVVIDVDPKRIVVGSKRTRNPGEQMKRLVEKGLRARLALQSLLTGSSMVELEFLPKTPVRLTGQESKYPEIPTVKSPIDRLLQKLQDLPIDKIVGKLVDILDNLDTVIADPEIKEMVSNLNVASKKLAQVLEDADKLILDTNSEVKGLTDNLNNKVDSLSDGMQATMGDARKLLQDVDDEVKPVSKKIQTALVSARVALDKANSTLSSVHGFIGERSDTRYKLNRALDEIGVAAKSLKSLMDYLERHPESLLQGKGGRGR
jgi:paraquat-inducible protein B